MVQRLGYAVDLASVKFDDETTSWIHAIPIGEYDHPVYGDVNITPERVQSFAANVNNKVREIDLDIDYDHKALTKEAAGWIKKAEARADGVWLLAEWTKAAAQKIKEKAYRYFSPELLDEWEHPKTKTKYKDVLAGGALTNRPFFKDLLPLNMSELFEEQQAKGVGMDPKLLRAKLGLPEDATDEQVEAKLGELTAPKGEPKDESSTDEKHEKDELGGDPASLAASEAAAALAKQFSDNPQMKAFFEAQETLMKNNAKEMAELRTQAHLGKIDTRIAKMSVSAKYKIPPAVTDLIRASAMKMSETDSSKLFEAFEQLTKTGMVPMGEHSSSRSGNGTDSNAVAQFGEIVEKIVKDEKMSEGDAMAEAARRNPQLFDEYRRASTPQSYVEN